MSRGNLSLFVLALTITSTLISNTANARSLETLDFKKESFKNTDCAKTDSCGLKDFNIQVEQVQVNLDEYSSPSFLTEMIASYNTTSVAELTNYGIAQFIRGCVYSSQLVDGKVVKIRDISRYTLNGQTEIFLVPNWMTDGYNLDPLDWSGLDDVPENRYIGYRWNSVANSFNDKTEHFVRDLPPQSPSLYVHDIPGSAFDTPETRKAKNISLEFRTCIYKSAEVGRNIPQDKLDFATPLKCFEWTSSFIFNHELKKFEIKKGLDDFCKASE